MKKWKDSVSYGKRWIVETVFSCIKRIFDGEYVTAIRLENIVKEILLKVSLYNWFEYNCYIIINYMEIRRLFKLVMHLCKSLL